MIFLVCRVNSSTIGNVKEYGLISLRDGEIFHKFEATTKCKFRVQLLYEFIFEGYSSRIEPKLPHGNQLHRMPQTQITKEVAKTSALGTRNISRRRVIRATHAEEPWALGTHKGTSSFHLVCCQVVNFFQKRHSFSSSGETLGRGALPTVHAGQGGGGFPHD